MSESFLLARMRLSRVARNLMRCNERRAGTRILATSSSLFCQRSRNAHTPLASFRIAPPGMWYVRNTKHTATYIRQPSLKRCVQVRGARARTLRAYTPCCRAMSASEFPYCMFAIVPAFGPERPGRNLHVGIDRLGVMLQSEWDMREDRGRAPAIKRCLFRRMPAPPCPNRAAQSPKLAERWRQTARNLTTLHRRIARWVCRVVVCLVFPRVFIGCRRAST